LGNDEQARASIKEAIQIFDSFSPWGSKLAAAHQAKIALAYGNIEAAQRWAQTNELTIDGDFEFHRDIEYLSLVRVLIAQQRFDEAYALARHIHEIALESRKRHMELETLVLQALICNATDGKDQALVLLEEALTIAQPEGYIRIFVDDGPPMARLLYDALSEGIAPDYVQKILAAFPESEPEKDAVAQSSPLTSEFIEPLSDRELEVLQLVADGLSRPEIANKLVLSLNTIKTHTRNIYSKLGVNNQMQAVGKARALGILQDE
jgi:LuxR family maltose regulon positive regulatory protein